MNRLSAFVIALPAVVLACTGAVYWQHHYYTWGNIKGSLTSLAIGALIMLVLRGKQPAELRFDLEDNVYRLVLLHGIVPVLAEFAKIFAAAGEAVFAIGMPLLAALAKLPAKAGDAVYSVMMPFLAWLAKSIAGFADSLVKTMQDGVFRQIKPHEERFSPMDWLRGHSLARRWQELHIDVLDFANSLSFGLLMAIMGLCVFLFYIITH